MSKQRHRSQKKRIVDVATALIAEYGLSNFRIDTLSDRLGYSRQNIYRYYASKQAILDAVIVEGCRSMAESIAEELTEQGASFDEQLIEGLLLACDRIRGDAKIDSYSGKNLSFSIRLFMKNAEPVQEVLLGFLEPLFEEARKRGELYASMSNADITHWLFRTAVSELIMANYECRESRKRCLLTMFSPSINARKARASATEEADLLALRG